MKIRSHAMKTISSYAGTAVMLGVIFLTQPAGSEGLPVTPDLAKVGWKMLAFAGKPATRFTGRADGAIQVTAATSVAILYRKISGQDRQKRRLSWRWRVDRTTPATDLSRQGHDDRPLALHLWFPKDPDQAGLLARLKTAVAQIFDVPLPGKVLTYVWGGKGRRGDKIINPYIPIDGTMIILRPGHAPTGQWFTEEIDFAADFERAFNTRAPAPAYIAVSADADDTMGQSLALITDIAFTGTSGRHKNRPGSGALAAVGIR